MTPADDAPGEGAPPDHGAATPTSLPALRPTPRRLGILAVVVAVVLVALLAATLFPVQAVRGFATLALLVTAPAGAVVVQLFVRMPGATAVAFLPFAVAGTAFFGSGTLLFTTVLAGALALCAAELPFAVGWWQRWTAARTVWAPLLGISVWTCVLVSGDAVLSAAAGQIAYAGIIIVPAAAYAAVVAVGSGLLRAFLRPRAPR